MKVKIKKLNSNAVVPSYQKTGDCGLDLTATSKHYEKSSRTITYGTSLAFEIPKGFMGLIFQRSSVYKKSLSLCNAVAVIDENFRGEVTLKFKLDDNARPFKDATYDIGDRIGQLIIMPYPNIEFEEVEELSSSVRGVEGWGSSGN